MDDYDWGVPADTGRSTRAGSSFMDRARAAPDDDDVPMGDARDEREQERESRGWGEIEEKTTLQQLLRHWTNERHAPDILPVQDMLLSGLLDHIRRQVRDKCN
jgi:GINS complex subunit 4